MLAISITGSVALLVIITKVRHVAFSLWRWPAKYLGPESCPSFWRIVKGVFPLALLSLGIGAWLRLAASPGMAKLAPGPIEDIDHLAGWFILAGVIGCAMRVLHYTGSVSLEKTVPEPRKDAATPSRQKRSKSTGRTATQLQARRGARAHRAKATIKKSGRSVDAKN